jgi:hypothetical protein
MPTTPRRRASFADGGPLTEADARTGETPAQDVAPTDEDIRLEAALVERRKHSTNVADWLEASDRLQQGSAADATELAEDEDEDDEDEDEDESEEAEDEEDEDEDEDEDEETSS